MPVMEFMEYAAKSVLDKHAHARIIADSVNVCAVAGVQLRYLHESMHEHCGAREVEWVRGFRLFEQQGLPGMMLCGLPGPDRRCQAICAALLRNYIDARVVPLNTVLDAQEKSGAMVEPHVLLIPNLYVAASGKTLPAWKIQGLYDLLLNRAVQGKVSVVYAESSEGLLAAYGKPLADHLTTYFQAA